MPWWLYVIIGFVVGVFAGSTLTRSFYFPKRVGTLIITKDPDDRQIDYVFLKATEIPDEIRKHDLVCFKIDDQTQK